MSLHRRGPVYARREPISSEVCLDLPGRVWPSCEIVKALEAGSQISDTEACGCASQPPGILSSSSSSFGIGCRGLPADDCTLRMRRIAVSLAVLGRDTRASPCTPAFLES